MCSTPRKWSLGAPGTVFVLFCFCLSLKLLGFSGAARVENHSSSHLYLRIVSCLISLCTLEMLSNCLLSQKKLEVLYIAPCWSLTVYWMATRSCLWTCVQESSVAGWAQELSLQTLSLAEVFSTVSVSLFIMWERFLWYQASPQRSREAGEADERKKAKVVRKGGKECGK